MNIGLQHMRAGLARRRGGFTLVELLVVVAIMGMLLVLALPAFEAMGRRSLSSASPSLMSTLRLARQYAITHRKYVWVVFPDKDALNYTGAEANMALRAYAVIAGDANNRPDAYVSEWRYLPQGIYFNPDTALANNVFKSYDGSGATAMYPFPTDKATKDHNMPAIQFRPNGRSYLYTGNGWSDFGRADIRWYTASLAVDTNSGTVGAIQATGHTSMAVRVFNKTGQVYALNL